MATPINRRNWLKSSLLITGALTLPSILQKATAKSGPASLGSSGILTDAEIEASLLSEVPVIKARLSANENPFGPSAKAKKAIVDALDTSYRYAFSTLQQFSEKIAIAESLDKKQVLLGAGSGSLLQPCIFLKTEVLL